MINNNDLTDVMMKGEMVGTKKMNIKGQVRNMDVYRIPIDRLYYNDKNDRIATWISKYESENGSIRSLDTNAYNDKIQEYIINSDKQKFVTTMNNIRNFSQLEAGVVFIDGRVIDGKPPKLPTCKCSCNTDSSKISFASSSFFAGPLPTGKITASYFLKSFFHSSTNNLLTRCALWK